VPVTPDTVLVQHSEPIPATVGDVVVMLSMRAGAYFGLNGVGSEIWNMLMTAPGRADLRHAPQFYDVDRDAMTRDVTAFLQALIERRLLRGVAPDERR
jgi:hypothetical protein